MLSELCSYSAKAGSLVDMLALFVAAAAFVLSSIQFLKDNSRQKREATLNAYNDLQDDVFTKLNGLLLKYKTQKNKLYSLRSGDEDWEKITTYLAKIERFSVGINSGIYSINVLNRLGGGYFIRLYDELNPIILRKRNANTSKGKHYNEFEATAEKLKKMRNV